MKIFQNLLSFILSSFPLVDSLLKFTMGRKFCREDVVTLESAVARFLHWLHKVFMNETVTTNVAKILYEGQIARGGGVLYLNLYGGMLTKSFYPAPEFSPLNDTDSRKNWLKVFAKT